MLLDFVGTGGAEGIPSGFCSCPVCQNARKNKGRNIRLRSSICINKEVLVDYSPDIHTADFLGYVDLTAVRTVLLTHSHADHCDMQELIYRAQPNFCDVKEEYTLAVYGNEACKNKYDAAVKENGGSINHTEFFPVKPFDEFNLGDITVTALPANHALKTDVAVMYLFKQGDKRVLYAEDTGAFPEATVEYLKGKYCGCICIDCAFCFGAPDRDDIHLGINKMLEHIQRLKSIGAADENTVFIAQHLSHRGLVKDGIPLSAQALEAELKQYNIIPAYDGLSLEI